MFLIFMIARNYGTEPTHIKLINHVILNFDSTVLFVPSGALVQGYVQRVTTWRSLHTWKHIKLKLNNIKFLKSLFSLAVQPEAAGSVAADAAVVAERVHPGFQTDTAGPGGSGPSTSVAVADTLVRRRGGRRRVLRNGDVGLLQKSEAGAASAAHSTAQQFIQRFKYLK